MSMFGGAGSTMSPEERATVVVALDHDSRQPQHAIEMGLRNMRIIIGELEGELKDDARADLVRRMRSELASVQVSIWQVVDTQRDLVDALRLEFDGTQPTLRPVRAEELIERAEKGNRGLAGDIELRGICSPLMFVSDERWVERILSNLIANAVRHSGGSRIVFGARLRKEQIVFEVRDNGRGMAPDKVARIFEPLASPSLSPIGSTSEKSGLGLYNVRLFAERLGGTVECVSELGRGTAFRVFLPGPVERIARRRVAEEAMSSLPVRNKMVAILDDDLSVLRSTERAFESMGIEVYADHDPLRWLSVVTDLPYPPDLVWLDLELKGQDSLLQLDVIRRRWPGERPKILIVTGKASDASVTSIARDVPVLQKPLTAGKMQVVLDVLAGKSELPLTGML